MLIENKRGFTLVEVLCSLGVFSIIFICMMSYGIASLNMKKDIKTINSNVIIIENLKNKILYSMTFSELNQLKLAGKIYINKGSIIFDENEKVVKAVFTNEEPALSPYLKLTFSPLDINVYKLNLALYSGNPNDRLEMDCNLYKGDYK